MRDHKLGSRSSQRPQDVLLGVWSGAPEFVRDRKVDLGDHRRTGYPYPSQIRQEGTDAGDAVARLKAQTNQCPGRFSFGIGVRSNVIGKVVRDLGARWHE